MRMHRRVTAEDGIVMQVRGTGKVEMVGNGRWQKGGKKTETTGHNIFEWRPPRGRVWGIV